MLANPTVDTSDTAMAALQTQQANMLAVNIEAWNETNGLAPSTPGITTPVKLNTPSVGVPAEHQEEHAALLIGVPATRTAMTSLIAKDEWSSLWWVWLVIALVNWVIPLIFLVILLIAEGKSPSGLQRYSCKHFNCFDWIILCLSPLLFTIFLVCYYCCVGSNKLRDPNMGQVPANAPVEAIASGVGADPVPVSSMVLSPPEPVINQIGFGGPISRSVIRDKDFEVPNYEGEFESPAYHG